MIPVRFFDRRVGLNPRNPRMLKDGAATLVDRIRDAVHVAKNMELALAGKPQSSAGIER